MKCRTLVACLFLLLLQLLTTFTSTIACNTDDQISLCQGDDNTCGQCSCKHTGAQSKGACVNIQSCTIGDYSCLDGEYVCNNMFLVSVGDNSCLYFRACQYLLESNVKDNSCTASWSCYETYNSNIDSNSCGGNWGCYKVQNVDVGSYSCLGDYGCQFSTSSSKFLKKMSIGDNSCASGSSAADAPIGQYICQWLVSTTIGSYSCNGEHACQYSISSSIGSYSCGSGSDAAMTGPGYLCQYLRYGSSIGDNSCNSVSGSSYACSKIVNSQIGSNSCNSASNNECQYCSNSNVPDNSCNNLDGGWGPDRNGNYWNSCEYCTNCKIQATGAQCYVTNITATATTTSSRRLHTNARKGKRSPEGTFDLDCVHLMETIQSFYTTLNVTGTDLAQMIPSQTKAKSVFRKKTGVCEIPLHLIFHHLESERLTSSCEALSRVFREHTEDFLINFKRFKGLKLSCIAKDINAQVITKKKKKDRKKGEGTKRGLSAASLVTHVAYPMDDAMDYALKSDGEGITFDDPNF